MRFYHVRPKVKMALMGSYFISNTYVNRNKNDRYNNLETSHIFCILVRFIVGDESYFYVKITIQLLILIVTK